MKQVKVNRADLLTKVTKNRKEHIANYAQAVKDYKKLALEELAAIHEELKEQIKELKGGRKLSVFLSGFGLEVPQNHTADYDRVIAMLEMSVDVELLIDATEFSQYVMDNWSWRSGFDSLRSVYGATGASGYQGSQGAQGVVGSVGYKRPSERVQEAISKSRS